VLFAGVIGLLPLVLAPGQTIVLGIAGAYALFTLGLCAIFSYSGFPSFSGNAFAAIGGYSMVLIANTNIVPVWASAILGALVVVPIAVVFGLLVFRLNGFYFAMATLLSVLIIDPLSGSVLSRWTNGYGGLLVPQITIGPWTLADLTTRYYVTWTIVGLAMLFLLNLERTHVVRAARAIKGNENVARLQGINTLKVKSLLFAASALISAIGGILLLSSLSYIGPATFDLNFGILIFIAVIIGGRRGAWGSLIGALLLLLVNQVASGFASQGTLFFGAFLAVMLIWLPGGITDSAVLLTRLTGRKLVEATEPTLPKLALPDKWPLVGAMSVDSHIPLLEVTDLTVNFGGFIAVSEVDLMVESGGVVAIMGPNGAGKTTLVNAITGYVRPSAGSVKLRGKNLGGQSVDAIRRMGVARTLQNPWVYGELTVWENIALGIDFEYSSSLLAGGLSFRSSRRAERTIQTRSIELCQVVGLGAFAKVKGNQLSYGQRRLLELARAIGGKSELLILDEPMAGLSVAMADHVAGLIRSFSRWRYGVILIEHNFEHVVSTASDAIFMIEGRVAKRGRVADVLADPEVIEQYVGI
jgi:ABC-type branched-subunit amino acid transport system ATPase component/ABC-type branched-subunit amino acid transport system permease subunit